jgi:hypothetical protein
MISPLFLISSSSAFAGDQPVFSIKVFTSPDDQFWVNSVIIEGADEVMLVDAQLTKTNAERVLQEIKETKSHCLLSTLPMSTPIIFLVWRFLGRHTRECGLLRILR